MKNEQLLFKGPQLIITTAKAPTSILMSCFCLNRFYFIGLKHELLTLIFLHSKAENAKDNRYHSLKKE